MNQLTNKTKWNKKAYLKYISSLLLFGTNGIIASFILLPSTSIVFLRAMIGSILLVLLFLLSKESFSFLKHRKDFLFTALSGIATAFSWSFLYEAYQQIGVSLATLLYYCGPVLVLAMSPFFFKEKITLQKIASIVIVLIGVYLINRGSIGTRTSFFGIFCGLMAALFYSFMVLFGKKSERITGLEMSALQLLFTFLSLSVFWFFTKGFTFDFTGGHPLPIILLGLSTGIGCYLYFSPLNDLPAQTIAISGYLEPLAAVLLSVLLLKETLFPLQILGAVLIIGGAILGEIKLNYRK
ncbi:MAG: DMT family transporter [Gallicola sp.]|nr:DMT family transporter [Gallicola sp.]